MADIFAEAEGPLIPVGGIDEKFVDLSEGPIDADSEGAGLDGGGLGVGADGACGEGQQSQGDGTADDSVCSLHSGDATRVPREWS